MTIDRKPICILLVVLFGASAVAQQITGSIRGSVVDPSGAAVQSASVSAQQIETGLTRAAMTDHSGGYIILELLVGHYWL